MPYLERIRSSFGRHDVSQVQAHAGDEAEGAGGELGARAFAYGDHVGFAETPDLHTAAHEAAHVVQQRGGVALEGGMDRPGDDHEQHADAVADAVVRGESAEPLLDRVASPGATAAAEPVVQRKPTSAAPGSPYAGKSPLGRYLDIHQGALRAAIVEKLGRIPWPDPASDLKFTRQGEDVFSAELRSPQRTQRNTGPSRMLPTPKATGR